MGSTTCYIPQEGGLWPRDGYAKYEWTAGGGCTGPITTFTDYPNDGTVIINTYDNPGVYTTFNHGYLDFDTSSIPAGATIDSITLGIYTSPQGHSTNTYISVMPAQRADYGGDIETLYNTIASSTVTYAGIIHDSVSNVYQNISLDSSAIGALQSHLTWLHLGLYLDPAVTDGSVEAIESNDAYGGNPPSLYIVYTEAATGRRRHTICHASLD